MPRDCAVRAWCATLSGSRCAESTLSSYLILRSSSSLQAASMTSRSLSLPMTMPTSTGSISMPWRIVSTSVWTSSTSSSSRSAGEPGREQIEFSGRRLDRALGDVRAYLRAVEGDLAHGCVGALARGGEAAAEGADGEHAAAGRDDVAVLPRRAGVVHGDVVHGVRRREAVDDVALVTARGVAGGRHHHGDAFLRLPGGLHAGELPGRAGGAQLQQVAVQARQHGLRLRVAEAAVELEDLDAGFSDDEAGVQHATEGDVALAQGRDDGLGDVFHGGVDGLPLADGNRAVAAHAAGVGPLVAGEDALVVLRRRQRHGVAAVAEDEQRDLGAGEELLDDDDVAGGAEVARHEAALDRRPSLGEIVADDDALAGGQAVGLDDQRVRAVGAERGERRLGGLVAAVRARRHAALAHHLFGEGLAALELRRVAIGAEDGEAVLFEQVADAGYERRLGAHHGEVDLLAAGEVEERRQVFGAEDLPALLDFASREQVDLTVVGPEAPLVAGICDLFEEHGLAVFGPNRDAAQLEGSKAFAKEVMREGGVAAGAYSRHETPESALAALSPDRSYPLVVKADGLAAGKGVGLDDQRVRAV